MQRATLLVREVAALVVCDQVDNRSLRQCCRLVEHEPAVLDTGLKRAHGPTVRASERASKGATARRRPSICSSHETGEDLMVIEIGDEVVVRRREPAPPRR